MKLKNFCYLNLVAFTLLFTSCKKDEPVVTEEDVAVALLTEQASAENFTTDDDASVFELTADRDLQGEGFRNGPGGRFFTGCGTVTVSSNATYFKIITIDYGTGCTSQGIFRSGKFIISMTDSLRKPRSKAVISFANYFINRVKREGTITYTNQSSPGTPRWERKVENGKFTAPNGFYILHNSVNVITQTAGFVTPVIQLDDEFTITGNGAVSNSTGQSRSYTITIPLLKKAVCANIVSGRKRIESGTNSIVLDYGNGDCDRIATISVNGGPLRTILLRN
jgi:hypothetical protein